MNTVTLVSSGELEQMSGPELVDLFNSLSPDKPVKRFSSQVAGVRRVIALLAEQQGGELSRAKAKRTGRAISSPQGRRRKVFDLPLTGRIKPHREGTKRALAIEVLKKGCKFEVMRDAVGWTDRQAYEAVRILHTYLGYGVTEDAEGIIRLTGEAKK